MTVFTKMCTHGCLALLVARELCAFVTGAAECAANDEECASNSGGADDSVTSLLQFAERTKRIKVKSTSRAALIGGNRFNPTPITDSAHLQDAAKKASADQRGGMSPEQATDLGVCLFQTCMNWENPRREYACEECIWAWARGWPVMDTQVGVNRVPIGYAIDMLTIAARGGDHGIETYSQIFCGGHMANCPPKHNFPGPNTTSYMEWQTVWDMGAQYPEKLWSGEWWRGAELGLLIQAPFFWSYGKTRTDPIGLSLAMTPSQHWVVRPIVDALFATPGKWTWAYRSQEKTITDMINRFFKDRAAAGSLKVPADLKAFQFQLLNKISFDRDVPWEYAEEFAAVQTSMVAFGSIGVLLPECLYPFVANTRDQYGKLIEDLIPFVQSKFGRTLDKEDCSPSRSCVVQAATAIIDAFTLAGGLSVPTNLATGLALVYSTSDGNPYPERKIPRGKELEFYWENIRFFAPVVGFPHWKKRPTCEGLSEQETVDLNNKNGKQQACPKGQQNWWTGYPNMNQYQQGIRETPNLAMAQRDPKVWGKDANQFVVRELRVYKKSVGFAEMAKNDKVAGGRMNRNCPGKTLALTIGTTFFERFNTDEWSAAEPDKIQFKSGPEWFTEFELLPREPAA